MKPVSIKNPALEKPRLLISCYDSAFDNYLSIETRKERLLEILPQLKTEQARTETQDKIVKMNDRQKEISDHLLNLDSLIHNYIVTHN